MLTGTATGAAQLLGISQPAVSRLIGDLETEVGFKLFERLGRRVVPTSEARVLIEEVRRAFVGLDRIRDAAHAIADFRFSQLRLVAVPSVASTIAVDLVKMFSLQHPDTFISLEVQPSDSAVEWITAQQSDLGIASPAIENPAIATRVLKSGEAICLLPNGHPLAGRDVIVPELLAGESFVSYLPDAVFRYGIDDIFRKVGVVRRMQYEARTTDAILAMVAEGLGVAIVGPFLPCFGKMDSIKAKPFRPAPRVDLTLMWSTHRPLSALAQRFIELIDSYFAVEG
jgi:DNA-binding transcriptional LysR family regulator